MPTQGQGEPELDRVLEYIAKSKHLDLRWLDAEHVEDMRRVINHLYWDRKMSLLEISGLVRKSYSFALGLASRLGIEQRPANEIHRLAATKRTTRAKHAFEGTTAERAYLIGFAEGDLDARRVSRSAIMVSSTTTHRPFAQLFRSLFQAYGPVYEYPAYDMKRGFRWKVAARLDLSFSFLLPEERRNYPTIEGGQDDFYAWLAGITDAEGSIDVGNSGGYLRVRIAISNQDVNLLEHIKQQLREWEYRPVGPYRRTTTGTSARYAIPYNRDMFVICIESNDAARRLLTRLPLRHSEKVRRAKLALSTRSPAAWRNVEARVLETRKAIKLDVLKFTAEAEESYKKRRMGKD